MVDSAAARSPGVASVDAERRPRRGHSGRATGPRRGWRSGAAGRRQAAARSWGQPSSLPGVSNAPLIAVDAPSLLYRAFHALPRSITGPDGNPVNALLGVANLILQAVERH